MFSTIGKVTINHNLLGELGSSGVLGDPVLFVYAVLGALVATSLVAAYAIFGRSGSVPLS